MQKGIVIASDQATEWLLPWWWKYYSLYNKYPVAFVDLGMSPKRAEWCRKRGQVIPLVGFQDFIRHKEEVSPAVAQEWEATYKGDVWKAREAWFKKPLACLLSPFELTVWMDIDCEVCGSLSPLFEEWMEGIELALVRDERSVEELNFSSGVILFRKEAPFLKRWAELCLEGNASYMGDQNALTELLYAGDILFKELNPIYNWIMGQGFNPSAIVAHWGAWGKEHIKRFGGIHELIKKGFAADRSKA